jgi:NTE family protein
LLDFFKGLGWNGDRAAIADTVAVQSTRERPSIGLVLGGGAARGFAHIGVIRTLLAKGLVPEVIAGTSIGAVVGGCYAAGHLDKLEAWARNLTPRSLLTYLDVNLSGSGLIWGDRLAKRLASEIGDITIDDLPFRFAAIATEIGTGHEIWLTRGRLVDAMRASYALPGIFAPVHIGGRWLVDGTLVNPVPVAAARAIGARLVLAVNLNADMFGRGTTIASHGPNAEDDRVFDAMQRNRRGLSGLFGAEQILKRQFFGRPGRPGISTVMIEAFNVMQDRIARSRLAGDPPDVLVNPRLGTIGLFDFHRAEETIALGAEATERALEPLAEALAALG